MDCWKTGRLDGWEGGEMSEVKWNGGVVGKMELWNEKLTGSKREGVEWRKAGRVE